MTTTNDTRRAFLSFFAKNGHEVLPSSPLVPQNDPTLMFTNAGMNQFKNIFTGQEKPKAPRAATSQKCVRAGGKHNDLDNVGYTARHHTFFEMLGNFSFGDYFKEQAIALAWELITKEFKLPVEKLYVTVYHTDDEAFGLWKKIAGLPEQKIIRIPTSDNFWAMGDTGPCGPCSEIFYDHGEHIPGGPPGSPEADGDRFIEIWNLVFMQFDQQAGGERVNLPKPSIDTGMGLERVTAVLQGVHDNYDIDLFRNLIAAIAEESRVVSRESRESGERLEPRDSSHAISHRVIADHLRASSFLIADGVLPSNEGRGYVLRRIMRRAMRHAHMLGCKEPLMHRLVPALVAEMGGAYPELQRAEATIGENLKLEEERFKQTLERGLKLLEEESDGLAKGATLAGEVAFKLYDTYGFPLDLTEDILRARGVAVDNAGFEAAMEKQKDMARAAWSGSGEKATDTLWFALREKLGATRFTGYDHETGEGTLLALVKDGQEVAELKAGEEGYAILDATPFYGESGGQVGDSGIFSLRRDDVGANVLDTQKPLADFHVHKIKAIKPLKIGDAVIAEVDHTTRTRTRANHSATHLLHYALRKQLGTHVAQKGSLVNAERLRFDFSHPKALSQEELQAIEQSVNALIWANTQSICAEMAPDQAIAEGAVAMFGEKYGDSVRVLTLGPSKELCGGTHVSRTGDVGVFRILSESSIASGVRRIEAVTMQGAYDYLAGQDAALKQLALTLKTSPETVSERIETLMNERKKLEKELAEAKKRLALGGGSGGGVAEPETIGNVKFIAKSYADLPPGELRPLAEQMLKSLGENGVVVLASGFEGKASVVVAVAKPLSATLSAVTLVQTAIPILGGKGGGGRPEMAQGGGPEGGKIEEALTAARKAIAATA